MEKKISVMVADDDTLSVWGLLAMLKSLPNIHDDIRQPKNGREVIEQFKKKICDIVFLDEMMPMLGGLETALQLRKFLNPPLIIFHTELNDEERIREILGEDFHHWLDKNSKYDQVPYAIAAALKNEHFMPERIDVIRKRMLKDAAHKKHDHNKDKLSQAELEVLIDYCNLFSVEEIAGRRSTSVHTVRGQLNSAKSRLGLKTRIQCFDWAETSGHKHLLEFEHKRKSDVASAMR